MRGVGLRLAVLTTGLLGGLLLILGLAVFGTMQRELTQGLQQSIGDRARADTRYLVDLTRGERADGRRERIPDELDSGGVFVVFASATLAPLGAVASPFGARLPDAAAARRAIVMRAPGYSEQRSRAKQDYLIYSLPVFQGRHLAGVVQTGISESQYHDSMSALLRVLILIGGAGLVAAAAISGVSARRALRPIRIALRRQRDFVADAAHELRTPVAIMRTTSELALSAAGARDRQEALEQALVQSNALARLIDDLSLLARSDSGVLTIARERVDLSALVSATVESVAVLLEERTIALDLATPGHVCVEGDVGRLRQLVMILLDNALTFTPDRGTIAVRIERHGGRARLIVEDSGPGIDQADLPYIFDRFFQGDRARSGQGSGLGLAIGRWIAVAHGGHIAATNAAPHGAIFTVTLPLAA